MKNRKGNILATLAASTGMALVLGAASNDCGGEEPARKAEKKCSKRHNPHKCKIVINPPHTPPYKKRYQPAKKSPIPAHDHKAE